MPEMLETTLRTLVIWQEEDGQLNCQELVKPHRFPHGTPLSHGVTVVVPFKNLTKLPDSRVFGPLDLDVVGVTVGLDSGRVEVHTVVNEGVPAPAEDRAKAFGGIELLKGFGFKVAEPEECRMGEWFQAHYA